MYNNVGLMTGTLAMTGLTHNPVWLFLSSFALLALGMAVLRTVPRRER